MFDVWMKLPQQVNGKFPWTLVARRVTEQEADILTRVLVFESRKMPAGQEV